MKKLKSTNGFTLVELIVVIAILAILAGIAVPAYSGYINKAKEAADVQALSSVSTAVQGIAVGNNETVTGITVSKDATATAGSQVSVTVEGAKMTNDAIEELTGELDGLFGTTFTGATWNRTDGWKLN